MFYTDILTWKVELWIFSLILLMKIEKTPQNNFSSKIFSVEINYFYTMWKNWKSFFLHWNDEKSCFVVFFQEWNKWKNPQFNFFSQNLSIEINFFKWDGKYITPTFL